MSESTTLETPETINTDLSSLPENVQNFLNSLPNVQPLTQVQLDLLKEYLGKLGEDISIRANEAFDAYAAMVQLHADYLYATSSPQTEESSTIDPSESAPIEITDSPSPIIN
jgi:hypothetical protein